MSQAQDLKQVSIQQVWLRMKFREPPSGGQSPHCLLPTPSLTSIPSRVGGLPSTIAGQPLPKARFLGLSSQTQGLLPTSLLPTTPTL